MTELWGIPFVVLTIALAIVAVKQRRRKRKLGALLIRQDEIMDKLLKTLEDITGIPFEDKAQEDG